MAAAIGPASSNTSPSLFNKQTTDTGGSGVFLKKRTLYPQAKVPDDATVYALAQLICSCRFWSMKF